MGWLRRLRSDGGSQMVEVAIASGVLAVAVLAVVGSMGSGMAIVGHSRQRSAGTSVATERLERVRNVPYDRVALYEQPVFNPTAGHPDNSIVSGNRYRLADGTTELLVVDTTDDDSPAGALRHIDDPFTLEPDGTEFSVYQYVTWVEDPDVGDTEPSIVGTQSYKRATVVVIWKFPLHNGPSHQVVESTLVSDGRVPAPSATPVPTPTASAPSSPSPSATAGTACGSIQVLSGNGGHTASTAVQVRLSRVEACNSVRVDLSNTGDGTDWSTAVADLGGAPVTVTWTILAGDGPKTIFARFTTGGGAESVTSADLFLDTTPPSVPANLFKGTCSISANTRTLELGWSGSTDPSPANALVGYRVYKSIDSGEYTAFQITSSPSASNSETKAYGLRFFVRAYDKAGNESEDSNVVSFAKNNC